MFNRIRDAVPHTYERCEPMNRPHRSSMSLWPAGAPRDPSAHNWSATAEAR